MFTWICPTCGREVPPAYEKCPDCAAKGIPEPAPAAAPALPAAPPVASQPMAAPPAQYAQQYMPPPSRAGFPTWLLTILFAFAFVGVGAGVYWIVNYFRGGASAAAPITAPTPTSAGAAQTSAVQKYVEIAGIRFVAAPKGGTAEARFLVINHSGADITGLAGKVNLFGRTDKAQEETAGSFDFTVPSLGPYESKEATAPLATRLKVYELPDWQNISTQLQITSP